MAVVGRHCRICGKPGGVAMTETLRGLNYKVHRHSEIYHMYAHADCAAKAKARLKRPGRTK
jgi:hypothetical protein